LKDKLIVALDVPTLEAAVGLVRQLSGVVSWFKVGLELFTSEGPRAFREVFDAGAQSIFFDSKFHDIPNTVAGAARAATRHGVTMFNVHALGGVEMMHAALEAAEQARGANRPKVIGVTMLTSIDQQTMNRELCISGAVETNVVHLARLAQRAELDGVVCSPQEIAAVRAACGDSFLIVTPGVRPAWAAKGDQRRVMTPAEAVAAGADYIVVGRPITHAPNPVEAAEQVLSE
jgi:orotidine-5'-phosphate decarboxylase